MKLFGRKPKDDKDIRAVACPECKKPAIGEMKNGTKVKCLSCGFDQDFETYLLLISLLPDYDPRGIES